MLTAQLKLLPKHDSRHTLPLSSSLFFFFGAGEAVTDGETECRDDEDVKCATFTHLLLYCLSLQEWSEGVSGKQTGGYKDTGLPSLIHQPIGLDRIHQLPRMHRLPLSPFPLTLHLSLSTLASPPVPSLSVNFYSLFAVYLPPSPLLPSPSFLPVCNAAR